MPQPPSLDAVTAALRASYERGPGINDATLPDRASAAKLCQWTLDLLFPGYGFLERHDEATAVRIGTFASLLTPQITLALRSQGGKPTDAAELTLHALGDLAAVRDLLNSDVEAAFNNDPAATGREVIVVSYPFIEALAVQRFAHCLYQRGVPLLPRMMTEWAHGRTGIDIHPGARIGASFFIDHGTGVVIGETAVIGAHCVLYQGVGLIAWNPLQRDETGDLKRGAGNKRHPELQDHVIVYAGASILGGDTVVGHHSVIGGNVWLTRSVAAHSVVTADQGELTIRPRRV